MIFRYPVHLWLFLRGWFCVHVCEHVKCHVCVTVQVCGYWPHRPLHVGKGRPWHVVEPRRDEPVTEEHLWKAVKLIHPAWHWTSQGSAVVCCIRFRSNHACRHTSEKTALLLIDLMFNKLHESKERKGGKGVGKSARSTDSRNGSFIKTKVVVDQWVRIKENQMPAMLERQIKRACQDSFSVKSSCTEACWLGKINWAWEGTARCASRSYDQFTGRRKRHANRFDLSWSDKNEKKFEKGSASSLLTF